MISLSTPLFSHWLIPLTPKRGGALSFTDDFHGLHFFHRLDAEPLYLEKEAKPHFSVYSTVLLHNVPRLETICDDMNCDNDFEHYVPPPELSYVTIPLPFWYVHVSMRRGSVGSTPTCCKAGPSSILRFSARHHREVFPTELTSDEEMERGLGEWWRINVLNECLYVIKYEK